MDKQIAEYRDFLHCDLVQEACHRTCMLHGDTDGELVLQKPISLQINDFLVSILSIDCDSGRLISKNCQGLFYYIRYNNLTTEQLRSLHISVVKEKKYSFIKNKQLLYDTD